MFKIGLIGAGGMGKTHHKAYQQISDVRIEAVCDIERVKAEAISAYWDAELYESAKEMLEAADIDAVDICLPTHLHRPMVELAASYGKHVFCEKPIASTVEDAQAMIQVCKEAGVTLMIGHVVRFFPEYVSAREQLKAGKIGEPGVVRTIRSGQFPVWSDWFADYTKSGGPLLDLAIHDFDYLRWCFGPVRRVFSRTLGDQRKQFDHTLTVLRFESGVMAHVEASWAYPAGAPFQTSLEIAGQKGLLLYDNQQSYSIVKFGGSKEQNSVPESPLAKSPYALELEHFIDCVRNRKSPLTSGEEALASLKLALAAAESAATGRAVIMGGAHR